MFLYRFILCISFPFVWLWMRFKYRHNIELLSERLGHSTLNRPRGDLIWIHVSDMTDANDIVRNLHKRNILLTYRNKPSEIIFEQNLVCQHAPLGNRVTLQKFIDFWEPTVAIHIGLELRPNQLAMIKQMNIPCYLVNGKVSDKAYRFLKIVRRSIRKIMANFTFVWAINNKQALRLANLGAHNISSQEQITIQDILNKILHTI